VTRKNPNFKKSKKNNTKIIDRDNSIFEKSLFLNNTILKLSNIPKELIILEEFKINTLKYFNGTFFLPYTTSKNRLIIDFNIEGSIFVINYEEDILFLISESKKSHNEPKKVYLSNLIILAKNQFIANLFIDLNAINFYRVKYSSILINVDMEDEEYKISDFINENIQSIRRPYFFIDKISFDEIVNLIKTSEIEKKDVIVGIEYNNAKDFFPKDYLMFTNKFLLYFLLFAFSIWIIMCIFYRRFFNTLHKWYTGIFVIKIFYTFIIICNLDLFFNSSNDNDDIFFEFLKTLYETMTVSINCIFKAIFLFLFYLIFEVKYLYFLFKYLGIQNI